MGYKLFPDWDAIWFSNEKYWLSNGSVEFGGTKASHPEGLESGR